MMEPGSLIQHWLRLQVSQYVKRQTALHQMQPGSTSVVIREIREEETQTENELALNRDIASGSQSKRGVELCVMEIHQSPHKKSKNVDSSEERKKRVADKLRSMSNRERCMMMERALGANEESEVIPIEFKEMWEYLEDIMKTEKWNLRDRSEGSSSQGGGGWPESAARSL